jgi:lipoprotein-releasing system permease protein
MFFKTFERLVAFRYLRSRKSEGFLSVIAAFSFLGIMLGVATLIIVMSVMNGFRQELISRIIGLNGHVNVYSHAGPLYDYNLHAMKIGDIEDVQAVYPMVEGQGLISFKNGVSKGVVIRGYDYDDFINKPIISSSAVHGKLENFKDNTIAIGIEMAKRSNLRLGDTVTLIAPKGKASPFGTIPRSRSYTVSLIFDVGMFEYNNNFIFMPLLTAQKFYLHDKSVSTLEVITKNHAQLDNTKELIKIVIQDVAGVYDWRDSNSSFFNALQVERNVMFLILTLIIIVAAFNIISSMIMLVKDKSHDIAIMRTMGATKSSMMRIFVLAGASIGLTGTIVGAIVGILFSNNIETIRQWLEGLTGTELFADEIYFLSQLPAIIDWNEVCAVILMAITISILATLYPAWRASTLDPVEALRYE